jgi:hypothetical protein
LGPWPSPARVIYKQILFIGPLELRWWRDDLALKVRR